jgi:hypothetical protein
MGTELNLKSMTAGNPKNILQDSYILGVVALICDILHQADSRTNGMHIL